MLSAARLPQVRAEACISLQASWEQVNSSNCPSHVRRTKSSIKKQIIVRRTVRIMFDEQTFAQLRTGFNCCFEKGVYLWTFAHVLYYHTSVRFLTLYVLWSSRKAGKIPLKQCPGHDQCFSKFRKKTRSQFIVNWRHSTLESGPSVHATDAKWFRSVSQPSAVPKQVSVFDGMQWRQIIIKT